MRFRVLRKSYINDTLYEKGKIVDIPEEQLAKRGDKINMTKHSQLEPLDDIDAYYGEAEPKAEEVKTESTESTENKTTEGPTDAEKAQSIADALEVLDPADDDAWTKDGKPQVAAVAEIVKFDVTRKEIEAVAPEFTRPQSE